jgi:mannose-6-phosphate isomerase
MLGKSTRGGLSAFFSALIRLGKESQSRIIAEVVQSLKRNPGDDPAYAWVIKLHRIFPDDIMALCPLILNLIHLEPGEAIQIPPGTLHAYLRGAGIELMANSDNVLRAGLTFKHSDSAELLKIVNFNHDEVSILKGEKQEGEWTYPNQAEEFILSVISVCKDAPYLSSRVRSIEIMICVKGRARITDLHSREVLRLNRGVSLIVPSMVDQYLIEGTATIYKASVPIDK